LQQVLAGDVLGICGILSGHPLLIRDALFSQPDVGNQQLKTLARNSPIQAVPSDPIGMQGKTLSKNVLTHVLAHLILLLDTAQQQSS